MFKCARLLTLAALLSGCSGLQAPLARPVQPLVNPLVRPLQAERLNAQSPDQVLDTRGGGRGRIRLGFRYAAPDFKTQLLGCKINPHLQSFRIFVIDGSSSLGPLAPLGLLGSLTSLVLPASTSWFPVNKAGLSSPSGTQTVTLSNLGSGKYYVAAAAYDGPNGTGNNITATVTALLSGGSVSGTGSVLVSDGGGEPGAPGRVHVGPAPDYQILDGSSAPLTINLQLGAICL